MLEFLVIIEGDSACVTSAYVLSKASSYTNFLHFSLANIFNTGWVSYIWRFEIWNDIKNETLSAVLYKITFNLCV